MNSKINFETARGVVLTPVFTTPVLLTASRKLGVSLSRIMKGDLTPADLIDLIWYACERDCRSHKISYENFMEEHLTLDRIPDAFLALFEQLKLSFPSLADLIREVGAGAQAPLTEALSSIVDQLKESGQLSGSSNSQPTAESTPTEPE